MTQSSTTATPSGTSPAPSLRSLWIGYAFAALGAALFSTKAIIIKLAYAEGINAETLLALRMLLSLPFYAAIGLLSVAERRRTGRRCRTRGLVLRAALVGMLGYWFASYTDFLGLDLHLRAVRAADPLHLSGLRRAVRRALLRAADPRAHADRRSPSAMPAWR